LGSPRQLFSRVIRHRKGVAATFGIGTVCAHSRSSVTAGAYTCCGA
jgi:hypothetical protein